MVVARVVKLQRRNYYSRYVSLVQNLYLKYLVVRVNCVAKRIYDINGEKETS